MTNHSKGQVQLTQGADWRLRTEINAILGSRLRKRPTTLPRSISHYELRRRIGGGAHGTVYLARDRRLNRLVAIKVLRNGIHANSESRERFFCEARCVAALNHQNIVTIHELGNDRGMDFVVMEYVSGKTLNQVTRRCWLRVEVWLNYAIQMARGLAAAHSQGIAHRDLKPSNFIMAKSGTIKLFDFGLAKPINLRLLRQFRSWNTKDFETPKGTILGTFEYMSPEQARGESADERSDIFSLGAIFYEMLSGRRAFQNKTPIDTMSAILHSAPPKLPARVPTPIARIVRRCLNKERSRRYRTATQLVTALTAAADLVTN